MTAISFRDEQQEEDHLEISENEPLEDFLFRIQDEYGDRWSFLTTVNIKSTDYDENEIYEKIAYSK